MRDELCAAIVATICVTHFHALFKSLIFVLCHVVYVCSDAVQCCF